MKKPIARQKISNHPQFPDVERIVVVRNYAFETDYDQMRIDAHIEFVRGGEKLTDFKDEIQDWYITNQDKTTIRTADGSPKTNPDYDPAIEGSEKHLKMESYNYFFLVVTNEDPKTALPLVTLLRNHIKLNDAVQFFDTVEMGLKIRPE